MIRILLLTDKDIEEHTLRQEARRASLSMLFECAEGPAAFHRRMELAPDAVVAPVAGLPGLSLREIVHATAKSGAALVLVGGETAVERALLKEWKGSYATSLRRSRLPWLPLMLEKAARERSAAGRVNTLLGVEEMPRTEQQLREVQKLAIVGRLAGSIAHEINNPLESITNLAYLLASDDELPARLRPYLELAQQELDRVAQISKQTLSFYRETQAPVRVELSSLMDEVLVLYARRLAEKRIELVRRYQSEEPLSIFPGEMRQVFANLLANAIEATEPGGSIVVRIRRARELSRSGASVAGMRVTVADSGCGIPREARARLGEPFYTTKGQRGTGLGLWVSQAIVQRCQGRLHMRTSTAPGWHGTTFSIFLPIKRRQRVVEFAPPAAVRPASVPEVLSEGKQLRANSH